MPTIPVVKFSHHIGNPLQFLGSFKSIKPAYSNALNPSQIKNNIKTILQTIARAREFEDAVQCAHLKKLLGEWFPLIYQVRGDYLASILEH